MAVVGALGQQQAITDRQHCPGQQLPLLPLLLLLLPLTGMWQFSDFIAIGSSPPEGACLTARKGAWRLAAAST